MVQAEAAKGPVRAKRAMDYRDGLMIAFLAYRPVRRKNLAAMAIGQHLTNENGSWRVRFSASETKATRPLEFPFPAELMPLLERYIAVFRPVLLASGKGAGGCGDALWVSIGGSQMAEPSIIKQIKLRTRAAFGRPLSPHMFRDSCATWIAIFDPSHVRIIAAILGHGTLRTSEQHYNQARNLEAGDKYHAVLQGIRGPARYRGRLTPRSPVPRSGPRSGRHTS